MQRVCTRGGAAAAWKGEIFQFELLLYELMWRFRVGGHAVPAPSALRFTVHCAWENYSTVAARLESWTQRFPVFAVKHVDEE